MTVGELLELIPQIAVIDVSIRNNGRYCYRWVVGKYIQIHSGYSGEKTPGGERIPRNWKMASAWTSRRTTSPLPSGRYIRQRLART